MKIAQVLLLLIATLTLGVRSWATEVNGFDVGSLDVVQVADPSCAPSKAADPICGDSVLSKVSHTTGDKSPWRGDNPVLGVVINGQPVAYPLALLLWHWVINDVVNDQPVVVSFCKVCGSGAVYRRTNGENVLTFGTSGLIYNNDMLLYDNQSRSLWSWGEQVAVAGPDKGDTLALIASNTQPLSEWLTLHPTSLVAANPATTERNYNVTPNGTSALGDSVYSGLERTAHQLPTSMPTLVVSIDEDTIAFPASELLSSGEVVISGTKGPLKLGFDVGQQEFVVAGDYASERLKLFEVLARPEVDLFRASASAAVGGR